jgi:GNAT superfamily N-acetyltransferase
MTPKYQVDQELEPGLRYTEEFSRTIRSFLMGDYLLWKTEGKEYIGGLNVVFFCQRLGAIAVPSAGIGGVETVPAFRRQGYAHKLLTRALASIGQRVPVIYLSDAIVGLYERYGFVTCLADSYLELDIRNVERLAGSTTAQLGSFTQADLPPATLGAMIGLYNQAHVLRSWTHERQATWNRLYETQMWKPGSEVMIAEQDGRLVGYAVLREQPFGWTPATFVVDELTARDIDAAHVLLVELAARCWRLRFSSFQVHEPADSAAGRAAKRLGCTVRQTYPFSGGMMGAILDRRQVLALVESELWRRADGADLGTEQTAAFEALCRGEAIPDNGVLLRLLVGHWSLADACALGTEVPAQFERTFEAWFPGGGTQILPLPYAHALDRY